MLVTWKGMFLVKRSLYNLRFCSLLTRSDSYRFFVKLGSLVKSISFSRIVCSLVLIFFSTADDSFLEYAENKNSVFVSISP